MVSRILLKLKDRLGEITEYAVGERRTCLIGRGPDCDLRLPAEGEYQVVSRHHCRLDIDPPRVRVLDLGSRNGTRLNGMQIGHPDHWRVPRPPALIEYELHEGDELAVGPAVLEVRAEVPEDCPAHVVEMPDVPPADGDAELEETRAPGPVAIA
jgi:pSer/pThr/pTyr-binding forkhead associated (FHA) protein